MTLHISSLILNPPHFSIIAVAFLLDLVLGDPGRFPHPVVYIGRLTTFLESLLRRIAKGKTTELAAGAVLAVTVPSAAFFTAFWIIYLASAFSGRLGWVFAAFLGYTAIAAKGLFKEPLKAALMLGKGDMDGARKALSSLVGRDTENLDEREITRALIETIAENTSDGVVAPLFYLTIGGPPLAIAYKAVNTLDSMVGYKNEKYLYFGRASARLDDIANYIPARLSAFFIAFAALIFGKDWRGARRIALRDGRNHPSPNSGYPEAAMAGALGRRLGGLSHYGGIPSDKPFIGDDAGEFRVGDVKDAGMLMLAASIFTMLLSVFVLAILGNI